MFWGVIGSGRNTAGSVRLNDNEPPQHLEQITVNRASPPGSEPTVSRLPGSSVPNWKSLIYISNFQDCLKRVIETNSILSLTDLKTNLVYGFYFKMLSVSFIAVILVLFFYFLEMFSKELPSYFFTLKGIVIVLSLGVIMILIIQLDTRLIKIKNAVKEINRNRLHTPFQQTTTTVTHTSYSTLPRYLEACDIPPMYSTVNMVQTNHSHSFSSSSIPRAVIRSSNESLN